MWSGKMAQPLTGGPDLVDVTLLCLVWRRESGVVRVWSWDIKTPACDRHRNGNKDREHSQSKHGNNARCGHTFATEVGEGLSVPVAQIRGALALNLKRTGLHACNT